MELYLPPSVELDAITRLAKIVMVGNPPGVHETFLWDCGTSVFGDSSLVTTGIITLRTTSLHSAHGRTG